MSLQTTFLPGVPSWTAHLGPDPEAATAFYASVLGWDFHDIASGEGSPFWIATLLGDPAASVTGPVPEATWIIAVTVDDLDGARDAATRAGGSAPGESVDIATLGRFHRLHDPAGAEIHAVEPLPDRGAVRRDEVGAWCASTLLTDAPDVVAPFYEAVLGWSVPGSGGVGLGRAAEADGRGGPGVQVTVEPASGGRSAWLPGFQVEDVGASLGAVRDAGGTVVVDTVATTAGARAVVAGPDGARFTLHDQPASAPHTSSVTGSSHSLLTPSPGVTAPGASPPTPGSATSP